MRCAPFLVVVLPYAVELDGEVTFAVFRAGAGRERPWHGLAGEGACGESPLDAARRTASAVGVPGDAAWRALDSRGTVAHPAASCAVAEYAFGVRVLPDEVQPPRERLDHGWVSYEIADGLLASEAHRSALFELRRRLGPPVPCC